MKTIVVIFLAITMVSCEPGLTSMRRGVTSGSNQKKWDLLLNPPGMKECQGKGYLYDREKKTCHVARTTKVPCTPFNVTQTFRKYSEDAARHFPVLMAYGWKFDQCGVFRGKPVTILYRERKNAPVPELELLTLRPE